MTDSTGMTGGAGVAPASTDLLGRELTGAERAVLEVYQRLRAALAREDLPPCAVANLRHALAYAAVAATDLALVFEHLTDEGL
jgi:hypothetical protein